MHQTFVHIGLSSWIIQDGNYGDFTVGQQTKFALEFYLPHDLQGAPDGPAASEHITGSRYRVRGRVVFSNPNVWVIDTGTFVTFQETPPPSHAIVGKWVVGEINLGIDPFFYFEYLHRIEGMPCLSYPWMVRKIFRETTPWIEVTNDAGTYTARDQPREAFVPIHETKAWEDDDGNANYVLVCEKLGESESI
jgi:hypothetical protein